MNGHSIGRLSSAEGFMPHGMCYLWQPEILALHVVSDGLITLAYMSIPLTLVYFVRKRADLRFHWIFWCFATFIIACGLTHLMEIWTIWRPAYWLSGGIKAVTALASVVTSVLLIKLIPYALCLASPAALQSVNLGLKREVNERLRVEEDLRQANATLEIRVADRTAELESLNRTLIQDNARSALAAETAGLAFWEFDIAANVLQWDAQMFRLYGRPQLEGAQPYALWADSLHSEDRARCQQEMADALRDGPAFDTEFRIVHPNGTVRHLRATARTTDNVDGHPIRMFGVSFDITDSKRADERFRLAIDAAPTGMLLMDRAGRIVLVNAQIENLFGYTRDELLGRPIEMLVPERFRAHHPGSRKTFFGNPNVRAMGAGRDLYGLRKDGGEVPIEIGLNPLHTSDGDFVLSSIVDITERKHATEQFRLALEAAPTGMLMMSEAGMIVLVNAQIETLFGYPRAELLGRHIEMLVPKRFRVHHPGLRKDFFRDPKTRVMGAGRELYGLRKDGAEVPIEIGLNPLQTSEGHFVLSSIADITDRKRAQEGLHALNAELEQRVGARTSELKERESLLQEIHHRVKNNLQVISSLINMQIRGLEDVSTRAALRDCQSRVVTMAQIHEMLYQSADYARVPFAKYAQDLTARVLSASGISHGTVALQFELEDLSLPVEQAIPCGLILNELVANSLKHAFPNGASGTIRVELRLTPDRSALLSVSDNGVGIAPTLDMEKLSSLGIQLVMTLVDQLEGHLEITRTPGSTFRITFPLESRA
jgi:PAS domain S-box-containing protein